LTGSGTELILVDTNSGRERPVATSTAGEILAWPAISPDGTALAAVDIAGGEYRLEIYPIVGGESEVVTKNAIHPAWLGPRRIVFSRAEEGEGRLFEIEVECVSSAE
jgi:Tol biopolymer transport system component